MVTLYPISIQNGKQLCEGFCLSTDQKPNYQIANGSVMTEIDTGKVSFFNEAAGEWVVQFSLQGG